MYRSFVKLVFIILFCSTIGAQDCQLDFRAPINYTTVLSGSYGEPRTRHFHAGIDYKQSRGVPRDTIYAAEDGVISRISVQPGGYGNALYINHRCDQTSVYAHLFDFAPNIRSYINEVLYEQRKYAIDHFPERGQLPIKKGQYIGIMGNTGRSSGPHLHFEVRRTSSQTPLNPALVGFKPHDNIPPKIVGIMLYELTPDNMELAKSFHWAKSGKNNGYSLHEKMIKTDALKIGLGIRTYDQMNGASNHNGIYSLQLEVDGQKTFSFKLDSIPFNKAKYIHSHMDYEEKVNNKYVTKCFLNLANELSIYSLDSSAGKISPFSYRPTNIKITVRDIENNESTISFQIIREGIRVSRSKTSDGPFYKVSPSDSIDIHAGASTYTFDRGTFCQPVLLHFKESSDSTIHLSQEESIPTFEMIKIAHKINVPEYPKHKYAFIRTSKKGEVESFSARWEGDSTMVTFVNELGDYQIGIDTVAPSLSIISLPSTSGKRCKFKMIENFVPQYDIDRVKFDVYLDDEWILCQHDAKTNTIWFDMPDSPAMKKHNVKIVASDSAKNRVELLKSFTY